MRLPSTPRTTPKAGVRAKPTTARFIARSYARSFGADAIFVKARRPNCVKRPRGPDSKTPGSSARGGIRAFRRSSQMHCGHVIGAMTSTYLGVRRPRRQFLTSRLTVELKSLARLAALTTIERRTGISVRNSHSAAESLTHRHLSARAEVRFLASHPRRRQVERHDDRIAARVPVFGALGPHADQAHVGIARPSRPPRLRFEIPQLSLFGWIAKHLRIADNAQVCVVPRVGERETDVCRGGDLFILAAMHVGDEPDAAFVRIGVGHERPRPHTATDMRREHAHANVLGDLPDARDLLLVHVLHPTTRKTAGPETPKTDREFPALRLRPAARPSAS